MARRLTSNAEIDGFVTKVIEEAEHHAPSVAKTLLHLADQVRLKLQLGRDSVQVYERDGNLARTCWVTINGNRWAFSYNYDSRKIDLRSKSIQGATVFSFGGATTAAEIVAEVAKL